MVETDRAQIPATPLFGGLTEADWPDLISCCLRVELGPDETVYRQGQPAEDLFVILNGAVRVSMHSSHGELPVAELRAGAVLGEISLLLGGEHSATVRTAEPTTLLRFPHGPFKEWLDSRSPAVFQVLRNLATTLATRLLSADAHLAEIARRPQEPGAGVRKTDLERLRKIFFTEWA